MANYGLDNDEAVITQASGTLPGMFGSSIELILTNKSIIQVNKGFWGGDKDHIKFPLDDLKSLNGKPNVRVGKTRQGEKQLELYFSNSESFYVLNGFLTENNWVRAITKAYKKRMSEIEKENKRENDKDKENILSKMEKVDLLEGMANYKKLEGEEKVKFEEALLLAELQFEPLHMELKRRIEEKYAKFKKMQEDKVEYDDLDEFCDFLEMVKRIANGRGFSMLFSDMRNIEAGLTNRMRRIMYKLLDYPEEGIREIIHALREEEFNLRSLEMQNPSKLIEAYDKLFEDKEKDHEDSEAD